MAYAYVEAVRALAVTTTWARHIDTLWGRYRTLIAITECHLGCDCPNDQARWFAECWDAALVARRYGVNLVAAIAWALVDSTGWDALLTAPGGRRESGVFVPGPIGRATPPWRRRCAPSASATDVLRRTGQEGGDGQSTCCVDPRPMARRA